MNDFGIVTAQKRDHARDLLRLWPGGEVGIGHRVTIGLGIDDAWKD